MRARLNQSMHRLKFGNGALGNTDVVGSQPGGYVALGSIDVVGAQPGDAMVALGSLDVVRSQPGGAIVASGSLDVVGSQPGGAIVASGSLDVVESQPGGATVAIGSRDVVGSQPGGTRVAHGGVATRRKPDAPVAAVVACSSQEPAGVPHSTAVAPWSAVPMPSKKRSLVRQMSQLSVDEDVTLEEPVDSSDGEDTSLVDPVSSSDEDVLKKFVVDDGMPPADVTEDMLLRHTLSADVTEDRLLQHALSVAAKPLIPRAKRQSGKPKGKPKAKPKAKAKAKSGKCPKHVEEDSVRTWSRVTVHLGDNKSYIKSADELGCMRCRWHLTPKACAQHKRVTEFMSMAMKNTNSFGLAEVQSILDAAKSGLPADEVIAMISSIADGDVGSGVEASSGASSRADASSDDIFASSDDGQSG